MASNLPVCLCRAPFGEDHAADCPYRPVPAPSTSADDAQKPVDEQIAALEEMQSRGAVYAYGAGAEAPPIHIATVLARLRALSGAVPTISEERALILRIDLGEADARYAINDNEMLLADDGLVFAYGRMVGTYDYVFNPTVSPVAGVPLSRLIQRARDYSEAYDRFRITREQMLVQVQLDALEDQKG